MNKVSLIWLLLACFFVGKATANSKTEESEDTFLIEYEKRFCIMDTLISQDSARKGILTPSPFLDTPAQSEPADRLTNARIAALKSKTGLEFKGNGVYRPGKGIGYDPEDPLVAYNLKVSAEVEWNIFQSSLYKQAGKIEELRLSGNLEQLEIEKQVFGRLIAEEKENQKHRYNHTVAHLLKIHSENLALLQNTRIYLLQKGKISGDELLQLINEKAEIDRQLIAAQADPKTGTYGETHHLEEIRIDSTALLEYIRSHHHDLTEADIRLKLIEQKRENTDYLQTMTIAPYVRYSYYNREKSKNTSNLDIGLNLRLPLSSQTAKERKILKAEKELTEYRQGLQRGQIENEVRTIFQELEAYNQNLIGERTRLEKLKKYLDMRTDGYRNSTGQYNYPARLQEYNAYLTARERLVLYDYQRSCKLIDLQSYLPGTSIGKYIQYQ